jgi:hypothetical protein
MSERAQLLDHRHCGVQRWRSPLRTLISLHIIHCSLLTSFPMPGKKKEGQKKEKAGGKEIGRNTRILKVFPSLPPRAMAEKDWTPSTDMSCHLQNLVKHGFMAAAELEACHVPEDPAFPAPTERYVVSFVVFYEWGFGMPPYRFLHSLLRYYGLELHHQTLLGVLHIVAIMTLCEAYLRIDPDLDLWKYFFCVWRSQDPKVELMIFGGTVIHVKARHRGDPYLEIPMPRSIKGWQKKWFYLRNDASTPLPAFTSGRPIPLPSKGDGVAKKDLDKLHPLCENLQ